MLETPMPLDLLDYSRTLFAPPDPLLDTLTEEAHAFGMPVGWEITPDVGRLFQLLCRAVGAKRVLEFGTLAGHSAYWFARTLPTDGKVISIEINPDYAEFARQHLAKMGVSEQVEVRIGGCFEMLPALERDAPFDVIFLDADKARYPEFLEWSVRVLRPGGLLLADNVLRSGSWNGQTLLDPASDDPRILAIRRFNQQLAQHPHFTSLIVPMRAGVAVGLFHG
ncbi:MAG TPA: O-methyltransferase [Chthonomonadaceae bacterium]|nr:O-methyltransferase [Chthonomonadaceae bacterium]